MLEFLRNKKYNTIDFYGICAVGTLLGGQHIWQAVALLICGAFVSAVIDKTTS